MAGQGFHRWLTDDQQRVWRSWLLGTARISQVLDQELRPHGLDLAEYEILVTLSEAPNRRLRMSLLAELVHQSRSRLTHTVTRMEQINAVRRTRSKQDGRGVVAELTDEGYALLVETAPYHVESVRRIFVDAVDPADYAAVGRAMQAVLAVDLADQQ
ncbi:MAG TPA: MarR family transcriptional regulator [Propionibacteriaceae bacterium]|nr:MarR family transcriptional regulator [Propionibacteriaceae bacterium]HPZ48628.1 MarR family transcriptional regulator [Propionibacteriaceae bacterium]HQE31315.1 MarR family transcriptional regulator [Propionibacteriaceae bacterium]